MAEIKRFQGNPVFNKPIGVVRPSTAGVQAAQALAKAGDAMFKASYEQEVVKQKQLGQETAIQMELRDERGNLVIKPLPSGLSPVAARSAQGIVDRRYVESLNLDMKNRAAALRNNYQNDPEGFDAAYTEYINETVKNAGRYSQQAREIGLTYAGQNVAALTADKLEFEDRIDFNNMFANLTQEIDELGVLTAAGQTSAFANATFNDLVRDGGRIDQLVAKHGDRLGVTQGPELKNRVRVAFYGGQVQNLATQLETFHKLQNPYSAESATTQYMRYVQDALRKGNVSSLPEAVRANLDQLGFNDAFLQRPGMARIRDNLASKLAVIEGNREEIFNSNRAARNLERIGQTIQSGRPISSTDAQTFLSSAGLTDAYALANELPAILSKNEDGSFTNPQLEPIRQIIFGRGGMPQSLIDLLGDRAIVQDIVARDPSMLRTLTNVYRQATITNQGGFQQRTSRGLSDNAIVFWNTMDAYANSVRTMDTNAFFAKYTEIEQMPDATRNSIIKTQMREAGIKEGGLAEFIYKSTGMDRNDSAQFAFIESYADELVIMHGHEKAAKILKRTSEDLFVDSKITFGNFPTRFAPRVAFPDPDEMTVFLQSVADQLMRLPREEGDQYTFGVNAFLAPDPREGAVLPSYVIVDQDGIALMANGEPLIASSNPVLAYRADQTKKDRAQLLEDALEAFEARLRFERAVTEARIDESNDMDKIAAEARGYR